MKSKRILVVDDDPNMGRIIKHNLEKEGYTVLTVGSGEECLDFIKTESINLLLLDMRLPGITGIEVLQRIKHLRYEFPVIMITAYGTVETAVEAMKLGAYDFISKPFNIEELKVSVRNALDTQSLKEEVSSLRSQLKQRYAFANVIGNSSKMQEVYRMIDRVIQSDINVLIRGETGTGKELVARAIHYNSRKGDRPFVEVNCSAIPETLLEEELFGYEKGAFTDAKRQKIGLLELADDGTLFLDEIGCMNLNIQAKLLRAIEEKRFKRLGGTKDIEVSARIIAATNKDLEAAIKDGSFREDLYYRLNVVSIELPPLRERGDDILLLAKHFIERYNRQYNRRVKGFSPQAEELLLAYSWPGNVRELKNMIERAILLSDRNIITPDDIPMIKAKVKKATEVEEAKITINVLRKGTPLYEIEKRIIKEILKITHGNKSEAARMLKISRPRLDRKIEKYDLYPYSSKRLQQNVT